MAGQTWQTVDPLGALDDLLVTMEAPAVRVVRDGRTIAQGRAACCVIHSRPTDTGIQHGIALAPDPDAPDLDDDIVERMRSAAAEMWAIGAAGATFPLRAGDTIQVAS